MVRFLTAWVANAAAFAFTAWLLGSHFDLVDDGPRSEQLITLGLITLIFTIVNQFIAPIVKVLSLPFIIVTFGLFLLVVNALLLLLTEWVAGLFDLPMHLDGFWWAVLAAVVISVANWLINAVFGD